MASLSLSPSAASRWLTCKASPQFILDNQDKLPKESSVWADEGVRIHELAAASILLGWDDGAFAEQEPYAKDSVRLWHDYVRTHIRSQQDVVLVEQKLPLWYQPSRNGITDLAIVNIGEDGRPCGLNVFDFKNGEGVTVEAVGNAQLVIYARNVMATLDWTLSGHLPVKLAIVQPRARDGSAVKEWELSVDELRNEAEVIEAAAKEILAGGELPFMQSDKACQFCPVQALCPAYARAALEAVPTEEPLLELPSVEALTSEQLGRLHRSAPVLKKYLQAVADYLLALGEQGKLPADTKLKLVAGRSTRKWSDEVEVQKLLIAAVRKAEKDLTLDEARDRVAPRSVLSPSAAEKMLKPLQAQLTSRFTNKLERLIAKPEGSPTLAPIDDKRPALNQTSDFQDLNSNEQDLL